MATELKRGDMRADGHIFSHYKNGGKYEQWDAPEALHRHRIRLTCSRAKERATAKKLPFDIDDVYLLSVFPSDGLCPALGVPMIWGDTSGRDCSPSLDRRIPELGYVRGNVAFISDKANRIKTNATTAEVCAVANYLKGITN
jgi:hypothetical protein